MTGVRIRGAIPYRLVLSLLVGAVLLYLVVSFVMQIGVSLELQDKVRRLEREITLAEQSNLELDARLQYVSSDAAAEEWARQNGWAKPNEVLVVVLAPEGEGSPPDGPQQGEGVTPVSNRESWWNLFFGER